MEGGGEGAEAYMGVWWGYPGVCGSTCNFLGSFWNFLRNFLETYSFSCSPHDRNLLLLLSRSFPPMLLAILPCSRYHSFLLICILPSCSSCDSHVLFSCFPRVFFAIVLFSCSPHNLFLLVFPHARVRSSHLSFF